MIGTVWTAALAVTLYNAGAPVPRLTEEKANGPKLVVKGKDYFLHALPPEPAQPRWMRGVGGRVDANSRGLVLLHTSLTTGKMKVLATGGTSVNPFLGQTGSTSGQVYRVRIAGVATDKERVYVLLWKDFTPKKYHLEVFRAADGVLIRSLDLEGDKLPKETPKETPEKGPLGQLSDGVSCFGTKFTFKESRLPERSTEKKR
jgi:hypothetical protein